jgi:isorenieratene synthase
VAGHLTGGAPVAIVGAGYAGMAAAVALAERGVAVEVFEAGPVTGGRAANICWSARTVSCSV